MNGKLPERRSYLASGIYQEYLYVFGGQDLKEGAYNNLWRLNIKAVLDGGTSNWEQITTTGNEPKPTSHLQGFVSDKRFYFYGGLQGVDSNSEMYTIDLEELEWQTVEVENPEKRPKGRDDYAGCFEPEGGDFFLFGGYADGTKSNDLWKFNVANKEWECLEEGTSSESRPTPRIGASLTFLSNKLYVFGG